MVGNVHVTLSQRVVKVTKSTIGDEKVAVLNHLVYTYIYIHIFFFYAPCRIFTYIQIIYHKVLGEH